MRERGESEEREKEVERDTLEKRGGECQRGEEGEGRKREGRTDRDILRQFQL